MKMRIIKYSSIALLTSALIIGISCNSDKLALTNPNELSPDTYFKTASQVQSAVNAAYGNLQTIGLYNRTIWFAYDNQSHENCGNPQLEADKRQHLNFTFDASHDALRAFWESCYTGINKANFVINNKDKIAEIAEGQLSQINKDKFDGEAKFMRALFYFMLVTRWGDVPLVLETPADGEGLPRTPKAEVWAQIESDLTDAANQCLDKDVEEAGRATSGAAWALLGKALLYQEKYDEALTAFNNVTGYSLVPNYLDNFLEETEHNSEQIFAVEFNIAAGNSARWNSDRTDVGLNESTFRGQEYGCMDWYNVFPSLDLRNEFEPGDPRYGFSFYSTGDTYIGGTVNLTPLAQSDGSTYPRIGWRKYSNYYKKVAENMESGINMNIIRYADVLLMMAECEANRAGGNLATAIGYMNQVRSRASVSMPLYGSAAMNTTYPVTNLAEFMVALEHERKVELCGEQVRLPDLVRWGRLAPFIQHLVDNDLLPLQEQNELRFDAAKHTLWPIPQKEIDANINISQADQNPGY
ncbi:MAG: RagB/SusD family nutrient uptake outer membrane protein [Bacteroidales bacterium]